MDKNNPTLNQVVYTALRRDFEEEHQHIDAVLSFYDETKAQVIYSVSCHKIALSAKSTLLRQLLIDHQGIDVDDVNVVLVGDFDSDSAEDLVSRFYDAPKLSDGDEDVDLWSVLKKRLKKNVEEYNILEPETIINVKQEPMDTSGGNYGRNIGPEEAIRRHNLTLGKVECFVMTSKIHKAYKGPLELREGGEHLRFHSLFYKGDLIPFVSCKECQKVLDWRPLENLDAHFQEAHCESDSINSERLETLIREKDPDIELKYTEAVQYKTSRYLTGRSKRTYLKNIRYKGSLVPFKFCTLCMKVVEGLWSNSAQRCVKLNSDGHECVSAMDNLSRIYAEERSRLHILEDETVDPSCLYIHPVRLDGADVNFAFCTRCHSFLPKSHAYDAAKLRAYGVLGSTETESHGVHRCQLGGRRAARLREEDMSGESTICSNCGKGFSSCQEQVRHQRLCSMGQSSSATAKGDFRCVQCSATFSKRVLLHRHLKSVHSETKDVMCDVCGMAFKIRTNMMKHRKVVHGEKTISCDLCEMKFSDRGTYRNHRMTHTGEKAYVCPFCQHGFIQGGPIRRHILQVHGMEVPKGKLRPFIEEHSKNGAGAAAAEKSE